MSSFLRVLTALSIGLLGVALGHAKSLVAAEQSPVTAIDILLEPDQTMIEHAVAANKRLLGVFPKGFALGETHAPHVSTLQRYVKTADLDKVFEAVAKVLAEEKPAGWKLKAYKYYYLPWKDIGLAGIVVEPTEALIRYQQKLIDAVTPFTVKTGTAAAFVTTKDEPDINQPRRFPCTEFTVLRHKEAGYILDILCSGAVLEPEVVAPPFSKQDCRQGLPEDGDVIADRTYDEIKAQRLGAGRG